MEEDYYYELVDLLEDESFIAFINHPSAKEEFHWSSRIKEGKINKEDYELAAYCIHSFHSDARSLTGEEVAQLWANIQQKIRRQKVVRLHPLYLRFSIAVASVMLLMGLFFTQYLKEQFSLILKRLAHYYGISIEFTPQAGKMTFTGKLDLKEDAGRVLKGFSNTAPVTCRKENNIYYFSTN